MLNNFIIITDIGSTTTKALLLKKTADSYKFLGYETAFTTVEKPHEDVKIGVQNVLKKLESKFGDLGFDKSENILNSSKQNVNTTFLSTSSAGGGLQILVIGLTKSDSASSAERAAYGVGGVLLDTIAIDDNRSNMERMQIFNTMHPDIILFCGGIDNGNLFSVLRLAEILKLAKPKQKFVDYHIAIQDNLNEVKEYKIPLVYAGNKDAIEFITMAFNEKFDVHVVPNLRPTMTEENLIPTKDKIHELFMNNVMEQAPGYSALKQMVASNIIPTPEGVLNTIRILGKNNKRIMAFDIGGATTDIYSNIIKNNSDASKSVDNEVQRTVSANIGMSYSIGNIVIESQDYISIFKTHNFTTLQYVQNYIGNKIIYPNFQPTQTIDKYIEHIIAIQGIRLSLKQHFKMHFLARRVGFLDNVKALASRDKWKETMYYPHYDKSMLFSKSDIDIVIGAGGIMSHASKEQAIFVLIESLQPEGVTELWRDKHFISPHLGILSNLDTQLAEELINDVCFEKLALYVKYSAPYFKKQKKVLTVKIDNKEIEVFSNDVIIIEANKDVNLCYELEKKICKTIQINKAITLIIDTRYSDKKILGCSSALLLEKLKPYNMNNVKDNSIDKIVEKHDPVSDLSQKTHMLKFSLPYEGSIFVKKGDKVLPDTLLGENKFDPPKIYVVLISAMIGKTLSEDEISDGLLIKIDDKVSIGDKIFVHKPAFNLFDLNEYAYSPVRGRVEQINYNTGTVILREIQDYPTKPVEVNVANILKIRPKSIKGYLKKRVGDFVYAGETLASSQDVNYKILSSPYTGTIQKIDVKKGTLTICYDKKPYQIFSQCYGNVKSVTDDNEIFINVNAISIEGKIGFGRDVGGKFSAISYPEHYRLKPNPILYINHVSSYEDIRFYAEQNATGLICNTMPYSVLKMFLNKDIGVALTGNEDIPFSIIILNGFSDQPLLDNINDLKIYEGKYVLMKPHTQIRAGATRPRFYIQQ